MGHIISYHIISYHIIKFSNIISYHIISYLIISYHIISYYERAPKAGPCHLLAHSPDDPQRIRVASVFELSVCLLDCLFVLCLSANFLILLLILLTVLCLICVCRQVL